MKRSPLERKTPLNRGTSELRRTPLDRGTSQLARSGRLAPRSAARSKQMKEDRVPLVLAYIEAGITCEISPVLEDLGISHHCAHEIGGLHERRKSGTGGSRVNRANLVPACNWCNGFLEDAVGSDRVLIEDSFLVVREGDSEWEQLSKRRDKEVDPEERDVQCVTCGGLIEFYDSPGGSWWSHLRHPDDGHDAVAPEL